jgi:6-phosphofructokinase 1
MVEQGMFGHMVALRKNQLSHIPLEAVANKTRTVPLNSPVLAAALAVGTSFGTENVEANFRTGLEEEEIPTAEPIA